MKGQKTMFIFTIAFSADKSKKCTVDEDLIFKIAEGNMEALQDLYDAVYDSVYGFALSITKNSPDAEDVLQDTFLAVHKNAPDYISKGKPMAWILTIAKNFALIIFVFETTYKHWDGEFLIIGFTASRITE